MFIYNFGIYFIDIITDLVISINIIILNKGAGVILIRLSGISALTLPTQLVARGQVGICQFLWLCLSSQLDIHQMQSKVIILWALYYVCSYAQSLTSCDHRRFSELLYVFSKEIKT